MAEITKWYYDKETELAYHFVKFEENRVKREVWIPKSQVTYIRKYPRDSKGVEVVFNVPDWLADKEDL